MKKNKLFFIVSEDKSFLTHRLPLAISAIDAGYHVTLVSNFSKLKSKIKNTGINVININFVRSSKHPLKDLKNVFKLIFILRKEKPTGLVEPVDSTRYEAKVMQWSNE